MQKLQNSAQFQLCLTFPGQPCAVRERSSATVVLQPLSRTAGEGGERSEPGEGSASPEFSASVVRPRRAGCLPSKASKGQRWAFAVAKNIAGLRRVRQALGLATGLLSA